MLLFYNGIIHTMDAAQPDGGYCAGRRQWTHRAGRRDLADLATLPAASRIDLGGRTLIPGFNDAHVHIWKLGLLLTVQIDARGLPDIPTIVERFRERAASDAAGDVADRARLQRGRPRRSTAT